MAKLLKDEFSLPSIVQIDVGRSRNAML